MSSSVMMTLRKQTLQEYKYVEYHSYIYIYICVHTCTIYYCLCEIIFLIFEFAYITVCVACRLCKRFIKPLKLIYKQRMVELKV